MNVAGGRVDASVVIPVRDGARTLPALLESLSRQTLARERFEVVVVSNASQDDTAELARSWGARVVEDAVPNRARARNLGAAAAAGDVLAFTDADCVVSPGWLEALVACIQGAAMAAGPVQVRTGDPANAIERFERLWRFGQEAWVRDGWAATANLTVRRPVLDAVGGFDAAYRRIGEDVDFCIRAGRLDHSIRWCPDAVVFHDADARVWPLLRRSYRHGFGTSQVHDRIGIAYRAWRRPQMLLGARSLTMLGSRRDAFDAGEWRRMVRLARACYLARVFGSLDAEVRLRGESGSARRQASRKAGASSWR